MEKIPIPHADRVVGQSQVSVEESEELFGKPFLNEKGEPITDTTEILTKAFQEIGPDKKSFEGLELEKTERDLHIINTAIESVRIFAREFGRESFVDLPLDNIHYLKEGGVSEYTKGRFHIGSHATVLGQVLVERRSDLETAITTFHELWHALGAYQAIQVTTEGKIDWYRSGFGIKSRDGKEEYFYRIDEALVGLFTKRFMEEVLEADPSFKDEIEKMKSLGQEIDTTRRGELKILQDIARNIYEKNKDRFGSPEDVISLFAQGQVTGNIMPIARTVEKTFGKGSFREFGKVTQ